MSEQAARSRRLGGREARKALRAAPPPADERPVRPGMSGGRFQPLSETQVARIHEAVLEVLESIGLSQAIPSCVEAVTARGARYVDGRLLFPRSLVEDTLAMAARDIVLPGQDPRHDMHLSGSQVYFGTAGAAVHMVDVNTREYRESTLRDLYDAARLVDACEHIHFFQRCMVPRDVPEPLEMDFNTCYAAVMGTTKHVGSSWVQPEHLERSFEMLHAIAGGEAAWRARPFVSMSCCFVVPPLRFAEDACRVMEVGVRGGMPILLLSAGQAGATSPAALAGSVVQSVAEVLAGLVYVNALQPGHPAVFGTWPFVSDLRTGAMSGGSGEQAVLMAAVGQMGRFYGLPTGVAAGMTDAKLPDSQAGYEKGYTETLAAHSGTNLVYESAGMHGSLLGFSHESLLIDNDMIGAISRGIRGIEVNDQTLSLSAMRDVCVGGPNHYLGHAQTLSLMQRDYVYPELGDRTSPKEWAEQGSSTMLERAQRRLAELLAGHFPDHVPASVDAEIRRAHPVRLPREAMRAAG